jgi:hypothetical protein
VKDPGSLARFAGPILVEEDPSNVNKDGKEKMAPSGDDLSLILMYVVFDS